MGSLGGRDIEEHDYMVEDSKKNFGDVKGMPEILQEFQQVVDIIKSKEKYTAMGAELPRGVLLSGPPGTGKTLIAKARVIFFLIFITVKNSFSKLDGKLADVL